MDKFNRTWIIQNALEEIPQYEKGVLTIRGLHYRLVARGMTNTIQHYKRVVGAMTKARWEGQIAFNTFSDNDRETIGETEFEKTEPTEEAESSKYYIKYYLRNYHKNRWENQPFYPEVFIEKKALQGVFSKPCKKLNVALSPCKGYPSLTFLKEASDRFKEALSKGKKPIILYFGDYDPSGEDIPRSIKQNLWDMGIDIDLKRISLLEEQVVDWNLPPAPAKKTDSRTANWDGLGQVELDAVHPNKLRKLCSDSILQYFNQELFEELLIQEKEEKKEYQNILKKFISEEL